MNPFRIVCCLAFLLLLPGPARLQGPPPEQQKQMYEDIEIMRRILNRTLHDTYASSVSTVLSLAFSPDGKMLLSGSSLWLDAAAFSPDGKTLATVTADGKVRIWDTATGKYLDGSRAPVLPGAEGVYLPGHGVVFTATLPPVPRAATTSTTSAPSKPLSEWERIRQQLRGEQPQATETKSERKTPDLADAVLKSLAENGKHFTQLSAKENLTVVVTFRDIEARSGNRVRLWDLADQPSLFVPLHEDKPKAPDKKPEKPSAEEAYDEYVRRVFSGRPDSTTSDYELLGDLQFKQGRIKEAISAYQKAVDAKPGRQQQMDLYRKLAKAYLSLEEEGASSRAYSYLKLLNDMLQEKTKTKDATPPAPAPLPSKLIVSAPKALLDQVGAGKITFEQFRAAARVEWLTFPAAQKKPAPPKQ